MEFLPHPSLTAPEQVVLALRQGGLWGMLEGRFPRTKLLPEETSEQAAARLAAQLGTAAAPVPVTDFRTTTICGTLYFAQLPADQKLGLTFSPTLSADADERSFYQRVQWLLNFTSNPDELWDVYDENRCRTGRLQRRGDPVAPGDYHLVVHCWIQRPDGCFLLTQRAPSKGYPLLWECTGGSALAGEDSHDAMLREIREETGLTVQPQNAKCVHTIRRDNHFLDLWHIVQDFRLQDVTLQPGETVDKRLVSPDALFSMRETGELVPYDYFDELFDTGFYRL